MKKLDDADRLSEVSRSGLIGSRPEERFDRLTRLVSHSLRVPVALISIVDDSSQFFKSAAGLPEPWASERQTPLTHSFCQHVVVTEETLRISDARTHPLVRNNLAIKDLNVIAYLGVPLHAPSGFVLGSLCAIDTEPHTWSDQDEAVLTDLAGIVEDQLGMAISEKRFREILNTMPQMVWSTLPDGYHDFYNDRWYEFTGVPYGSTDGEGWNGMFHADDQQAAWARWRHSLATGDPYEIEYRLRHHSGEYRWTLGRALPIKDSSGRIERWFGTCTDIHDLKEAEASRDLVTRELSHRIQNIFAAVGALISMAARAQPEARDFANDIASRIHALSHAHRYARTDRANPSARVSDIDNTILGLAATVLAPYKDGGQVSIKGADVAITPGEATSLALILHELATNSLKYGALSKPEARLVVTVSNHADSTQIAWTEHGGPAIAVEPASMGFGTRLIASMAKALNASIDRSWQNNGLNVIIKIPRALRS